jgi:hypothetical protein
MGANPAWKRVERQVASIFGSVRNPLSGSGSGHTGSDTRHPTLFIECKHRQKHQVVQALLKLKAAAKKEKKVPVLALHEKGRHGVVFCIHEDDLMEVAIEYMRANCCSMEALETQ